LEKTTPEPNLTCGWLIYLSICLTTRYEGNLFGQYFEFIFRKTKKKPNKRLGVWYVYYSKLEDTWFNSRFGRSQSSVGLSSHLRKTGGRAWKDWRWRILFSRKPVVDSLDMLSTISLS
jgi:hypothetical protein